MSAERKDDLQEHPLCMVECERNDPDGELCRACKAQEAERARIADECDELLERHGYHNAWAVIAPVFNQNSEASS